MKINKSGTQASGKEQFGHFTGQVHIDPLLPAEGSGGAFGALVTFEPGARTAWHTHSHEQILVITDGCGWVQSWGGPIQEVHPGDVIIIASGEKHWHGATS